ncbi:calcium-dependent lipid-binding family protein [Tanacetum coccineum]
MEFLLTIHSAKALKKPKLSSSSMKPYVRISIHGYPSDLKTKTDEKHGSDPVWEYGLKIELREPYERNAVVVFEIMHESSTRIDRSMGKVKVPVKHFMSGDVGHAKKFSYPIHLSSGKHMGELIMSHMINTPDGDKCEDGDEPQAYIPTLEVPNDRPRPSRLSASNGIRLVASCLSISANVKDFIDG